MVDWLMIPTLNVEDVLTKYRCTEVILEEEKLDVVHNFGYFGEMVFLQVVVVS